MKDRENTLKNEHLFANWGLFDPVRQLFGGASGNLRSNLRISKNPQFIPLRFRKAGRVWCGGARGTH